MKNILVPIDFSACSYNAFDYACKLANATNIKQISLVHIIDEVQKKQENYKLTNRLFKHQKGEAKPSFEYLSVRDNNATTVLDEITELQLRLEEMVVKYALDAQTPDIQYINFDFYVQLGKTSDCITNLVAKQRFDLVVQGTKSGAYRLPSFSHSITADLVLQMYQPMLVVPEQVAFTVPKKIVFAMDYEKFDKRELYSLEAFAEQFDSELILLHFSPSKSYFTSEQFLTYRQLIVELQNYEKMRLELLESTNYMTKLNEFIERNQIDMLVMLSRKGYVDHPFAYDSFTRKVSLHTNIPLMVLHE